MNQQGSPPGSFDLAAYQRNRIRTLERENAHLEAARQRLERLLAIALKAAAGQDCTPYDLLRVIEELDRIAQQPAWTIERLAQLLRDTDPDKIRKAVAA